MRRTVEARVALVALTVAHVDEQAAGGVVFREAPGTGRTRHRPAAY